MNYPAHEFISTRKRTHKQNSNTHTHTNICWAPTGVCVCCMFAVCMYTCVCVCEHIECGCIRAVMHTNTPLRAHMPAFRYVFSLIPHIYSIKTHLYYRLHTGVFVCVWCALNCERVCECVCVYAILNAPVCLYGCVCVNCRFCCAAVAARGLLSVCVCVCADGSCVFSYLYRRVCLCMCARSR